ncbi:beta-N-acetylhexosaminidase [Maribellus sp. YY47]|uniref:beta-N-acetylhexosaminidase n=1 Tax=Maribellus sp. YY47 TaxID=2929486 RepID=UPI002000B4D1|nr:beta-N-acetylhexosaminidase [Maribellus sp. YY47]MCK3683483.1 family 20 glycosylhydrolase [Maribellus sp. YY47]
MINHQINYAAMVRQENNENKASSLKQLYTIVLFICLVCPFTGQAAGIHILPQPSGIEDFHKEISLKQKLKVFIDQNANLDKDYLLEVFTDEGFTVNFSTSEKGADVVFKLNATTVSEKDGYRLSVYGPQRKKQIYALANSTNGLLYALQSFRQLIIRDGEALKVPACEIQDSPAFGWRAFMLDESRHFQGKEVVKKLLDEMARLKMNVFHWHLVDDPGWRVEIKKYPLLTEIGSRGNFTMMREGITPMDSAHFSSSARWFYTQDEIREMVDYAHARGIVIMPEIEIPGHVTASLYAYPWLGASSKQEGKTVAGDLYDVTDPKMLQFFYDVLDEVMTLFPDGIVHIGGDEANYVHWQNSPAINAFMQEKNITTYTDLQIWAINRVSKHLSGKGLRMMGWNEITGENIRNEAHVQKSESETLAPGTVVQFWDGEVSLINKAIAKGYDVVNSNRIYTYLDYGYETTSLEKAYSFQPIPEGIAEGDKQKILGIGCQMWGEYTPTPARLYYQTFPRIAAFAEVGWVAQERKGSYQSFRERLKPLETIWEKMGYLNDQKEMY